MREITTHKVANVDSPRIFAVDEADPDAGGMHHVYAVVWGTYTDDDPGDLGNLDGEKYSFVADLPGKLTLVSDTGTGSLVKGCLIKYQHGPVLEVGANGLHGECLRAIEMDRLESAQAGPFACQENEDALVHMEESLQYGRLRTLRRRDAGAEGRNVRVDGDYDAR
tara:strand:+ start:1626 stop:2123 length:498 start_codon:yes stop_codon:yes gene_type:complete